MSGEKAESSTVVQQRVMCDEHPTKELEFFNPTSKALVCSLCIATGSSVGVRCQDIPTAMADHGAVFERVKQEGQARQTELALLDAHLTQQLSVVDVRENDSLRRLKQEAERLVLLIRRREEELCALVTSDCEQQRSSITSSLNLVKHSQEVLGKSEVIFTDPCQPGALRLRSTHEADRLLHHNNVVLLPDTSQYSVSSRAVVPEAHLSLSRVQTPMHPPHGCTIALSERVALQSCGGGGLDGDDEKNANNLSQNTDCPNGLFHFLATGGGTREYINPAISNLINVSCDVAAVLGEPSALVDERSALAHPLTHFRAKSCEGTRIIFDFKDRRVQLHSYLLQHGHEREHAALRSWKLMGSNTSGGPSNGTNGSTPQSRSNNNNDDDDETSWSIIDTQSNNKQLTGPYTTSVYPLRLMSEGGSQGGSSSPPAPSLSINDAATRPTYRRIALVNTGPDAAGMHHIELSRVEFYGRLLA